MLWENSLGLCVRLRGPDGVGIVSGEAERALHERFTVFGGVSQQGMQRPCIMCSGAAPASLLTKGRAIVSTAARTALFSLFVSTVRTQPKSFSEES